MVRLIMLRHAPTAWNAEGRYQGRADIPLSSIGAQSLVGLRVPDRFAHVPWVVSPLLRTRQTAAALGLAATPEPAVIEMSWGAWEGRQRDELRAELGPRLQENEDRGLDFRPEDGESPRNVRDRVLTWARSLDGDRGVVTHKGVIRAVYAAARDWPMLGKMPDKLNWRCLQIFELDGASVRPAALNVPLEVT